MRKGNIRSGIGTRFEWSTPALRGALALLLSVAAVMAGLDAPATYAQTAPTSLTVDLSVENGDLRITGRGDGAAAPPGIGMADNIGTALASADLNGDSSDDLVIAAEIFTLPDVDNDNNVESDAGQVYVQYGGSQLPAISKLDLLTDTLSVTITGETDESFLGAEIVSGDVNGDGVADLLLGARGNGANPTGAVFVEFGNSSLSSQIDYWRKDASATVRAAPGASTFAERNSMAVGDVSGDSVADIIVADALADRPGGAGQDAGEVYIINGGNSLTGTIDLSMQPPSVIIRGRAAGDGLGRAVTAGDIDDDGKDDIVISGMLGGSPATIVVPGAQNLPVLIDLGMMTPTIVISVEAESLLTGDLNGDNRPDLVVAAPAAQVDGKTGAGRVIVYYNSTLNSQPAVPLALDDADLIVEGQNAFERLGDDVAIGDFNNDGYDDLFIGVSGATPAGRGQAGTVYGILGRPELRGTYSPTQVSAVTILGDDDGDGLGRSLTTGDLNNDGFVDLAAGAPFALEDSRPQEFKDVGEVVVVYGRNLSLPPAWSSMQSPTSNDLYGIAFAADDDGVSVGDGGTILHFDGTKWTAVQSPTNQDLRAVAALPGGEAWTVGAQGTILRRSGGQWSSVASPTSDLILGIAMRSPTDGWAVTLSGQFLRYDGNVWSLFNTNATTSTLEDVALVGPAGGFAVGDFDIFAYDASDWKKENLTPSDSLTAVAMRSGNNGWAAGNGGALVRYNGSWTEVSSPTQENLAGVAFTTGGAVWAVGSGGALLAFLNGAWNFVPGPTRNNLYDVAFAPGGTGYAVGADGTILRLDAKAAGTVPSVFLPLTLAN